MPLISHFRQQQSRTAAALVGWWLLLVTLSVCQGWLLSTSADAALSMVVDDNSMMASHQHDCCETDIPCCADNLSLASTTSLSLDLYLAPLLCLALFLCFPFLWRPQTNESDAPARFDGWPRRHLLLCCFRD